MVSPAAVPLDALEVVNHALDEIRPQLRATTGNVTTQLKDDGTPVTAIDLEVDRLLAEVLQEHFPDHGIVSEERDTFACDRTYNWIVDPIDGTSNFIAGLPYWCVSVGLARDGEVVLAVVDAPMLDRRYHAIRGAGAFRDGHRLEVAQPVDPRDGRNAHIPIMLTSGTARRARAAGLRLNARVMGSAALDLAMVAEGSAVGSIAIRPHVWDIAAGALLVEEAGGATVTLRGEPLLPLQAGKDHAQIAVPTAAAATDAYANDLATGLLPT